MEKLSNLLLENDDYLLSSLISRLEKYINIEEIMTDIYKKNYEYIDYNDEMGYKVDMIEGKNVVVPNLDLSKYKEEINPIRKIKSLSDLRRFVIRYQDIIIENIYEKHDNFKPDLIYLGGNNVFDLRKNNRLIDEIFEFLLDGIEKIEVKERYNKENGEKYIRIQDNILGKLDFLLDDDKKLDNGKRNQMIHILEINGIKLGYNTNFKKYKEYIDFVSKLGKDISYRSEFNLQLFFTLNKELNSYYSDDKSINILKNLFFNLNKEQFIYFYNSHFLKNSVIKLDLFNEEEVYHLIRYFYSLQKDYAHDIYFITEKSQINFVLENKEIIKILLDNGVIYDTKHLFGINDKKLLGVISHLGISTFIEKIKDIEFLKNLYSFINGEARFGFFKNKILESPEKFIKKYT